MAVSIDMKIEGPNGTKHQKIVVLGSKSPKVAAAAPPAVRRPRAVATTTITVLPKRKAKKR